MGTLTLDRWYVSLDGASVAPGTYDISDPSIKRWAKRLIEGNFGTYIPSPNDVIEDEPEKETEDDGLTDDDLASLGNEALAKAFEAMSLVELRSHADSAGIPKTVKTRETLIEKLLEASAS